MGLESVDSTTSGDWETEEAGRSVVNASELELKTASKKRVLSSADWAVQVDLMFVCNL
jgi:hypothetical protein